MVLGSSEAIRGAAIAGLGLTCIPRRLVRDALDHGHLVTVRSPLPPMHRTLYIVHHQKKTFSQPLQRFLQFCQNWQDDSFVSTAG